MLNPNPQKPIVWLAESFKTPPFSLRARVDAGKLLRRLQAGENLGLPNSKPMRSIGAKCHELRVDDENRTWRIVYRIDADAIVVAHVFDKTTQKTDPHDIQNSKDRLKAYDRDKIPKKQKKVGRR